MNGFESASEVERKGLAILIPYMRKKCPNSELVSTSGLLFVQKVYGDIIRNQRNSGARIIEFKIEEKLSKNLFIETWSNRALYTPGWLYTSQADVLWYYFLDGNELYGTRMDSLRGWCIGRDDRPGGMYEHPEKRQRAREQLNDTWGRCVPIEVLKKSVETFAGPFDPLKLDEIAA